MKKKIFIISNLISIFLVSLVLYAFAASATFNHSSFNKLLAKNVSNSRIKYSAFKGDTNFSNYLRELENAKLEKLPKNEQLAFWINAYNALVIQNVLDNPSIKKPTDVKGFFDAKKFKVTGKNLTLNEIENDMIRAKFNEPLIHFGLVCGAVSCPPITNKAYSGKTVLSTLEGNAKKYLASKENKLDVAKKTIFLSKIFEWYEKDFGTKTGTINFIKKYGTKEMQDFIAANPDSKIAYLDYDWTLNSK